MSGSRASRAILFGWVCPIGAAFAGLAAQAQPAPVPSRGELLYANHCVACHTEQMHWRMNKQARDWDTLRAQVQRWQGMARLGWSDADIDEVTRHLNDTIYQFPQPSPRAGTARGSGGR